MRPAGGLEPAEDLFHPFALALTKRVPWMTDGALVNNTGYLRAKCGVARCSPIASTSSLRSYIPAEDAAVPN